MKKPAEYFTRAFWISYAAYLVFVMAMYFPAWWLLGKRGHWFYVGWGVVIFTGMYAQSWTKRQIERHGVRR